MNDTIGEEEESLSATEAEWTALAGDNYCARNGMARLHGFFKDAPVLGSLINTRAQGGNLIEADFHELAPLLTAALALKDKDRSAEPTRSKSDYPWFWCKDEPGTDPIGGKEFVGNRWNNVHLTLARKKEASS